MFEPKVKVQGPQAKRDESQRLKKSETSVPKL